MNLYRCCIGSCLALKKLLIALCAIFLTSCVTANEKVDEKQEFRNNIAHNINDNIDYILATDSLTDVWHIEDHILEGEEIDHGRLLRFTDTYVMNEEKFESLNGYEKGLVMMTSAIISKYFNGKYEDKELLKSDIEEYYDVIQNGDEFYLD